MKMEIMDIDGYPWILFTSESNEDWLELSKLRDEMFRFETDNCYAQYQVYTKLDQVGRQFQIKLDNTAMEEEIDQMKNNG